MANYEVQARNGNMINVPDFARLNIDGLQIIGDQTTDWNEPYNKNFLALDKKIKSVEDSVANIDVSGTGTSTNVDLTAVSTNIIPTTNGTIDIGSPTNRFRNIYVNEARLSTNTLYIGDTPILGTSASTINIHADAGQSISMKTTGDGVTTSISSDSKVQLSTNGMNADVVIQASGSGSKLRMGSDQAIELNSDVIAQNDLTVVGNVTIQGDLNTTGTVTTVNSINLQIKDNMIDVNVGEIGEGITSGSAGLRVMRGGLPAAQIIFDEIDDMFKVGIAGEMGIVATQEWVTANSSVSSGGFGQTAAEVLDELPVL